MSRIECLILSSRYVTMCEANKLSLVDVDLLRCLSCDLIPKLLIEKYLVEICRNQNVPFEPDPTIMAQDEFWAIGQRYVQPSNINDEKRPPTSGPSGGSSGGAGGGHVARQEPPALIAAAQPSAPLVSETNKSNVFFLSFFCFVF